LSIADARRKIEIVADRLQLPPTALFWYTYRHVPELRDLVDAAPLMAVAFLDMRAATLPYAQARR
jgi:hypothetical protein